MTTKIEPKKHARISPSTLGRIFECPGSVQLTEQLNPNGERTSNEAAAQGTVAHELGDICLDKIDRPHSYIGRVFSADGFDFTVDDEMADAVKIYVDYVFNTAHEVEGLLHTEVWGDLSFLGVPGLTGGTTDGRIISHERKKIYIIDYKHGFTPVDVENNKQLKAYGLSTLQYLNNQNVDLSEWEVILVIVQPRAMHPDGPIREWGVPAQEIGKWGTTELVDAVNASLVENPKFSATDDACRFCEAKGECRELMGVTRSIATVEFNDMGNDDIIEMFPPIKAMSVVEKINVVKHAKLIKAFIAAVEKTVQGEMEVGSTDYADSFKLVRKTTRRSFNAAVKDPDFSELLDHLPDDVVFTKKLNGIGVIEKALQQELGKEDAGVVMATVTSKPDGAPTMVQLSDRRSAIALDAKTEFAELKDDD